MLRRISGVLVLCLVTLAFGCKEDSSPFSRGEPSLSLRAAGPCGIAAAPTVSAEEFEAGEYSATARITVTGVDPYNPGDLLNPSARVTIKLVDSAQDVVAGFVSTDFTDAAAQPSEGRAVPFEGRTAQDELFCLGAEVVWIQATVANYVVNRNGVEETITLESDQFPIKCLDPADYQTLCEGGQLPDVGVAPDMETVADMEVMEREPTWSLQFAATTAEDLVIGIRDSGGGRPDSVKLKFQVIDIDGTADSGNGLEGVTVNFELPDIHPSGVEIEPSSAVTNADGFATVTLLAGGTPGVVKVNATASVEEGESLSARSGTVVIRGGIPSGRGFQFLCEHPVVTAFTGRKGSGEYLFGLGANDGTNCTVQLADRVNGVVDLSTQLFFLSEAGTIIQSARTDEQGLANTRLGVGPPAPFEMEGLDSGLVTLVAVTRGEEDFYDVDGDKIWDNGLDFQRPEMDLPEPFLDVNDNLRYDEFDENDFFVEEFRDTDGDGFWTEANGLWDSDIEIWQTTYVLWVGHYNGVLSNPAVTCIAGCSTETGFRQQCDSVPADIYLAPGGRFSVDWTAQDDNGNCLSGYGAGVYNAESGSELTILGDDELELRYDCFEYSNPEVRVQAFNPTFSVTFADSSDLEAPDAVESDATISLTYQQLNNNSETVTHTYKVCR